MLHRRPKTSGPRSLRCGFCRRRLCGPILCRSSRHARRIIAIPSWSWLAGLGLILVERFYGLAQVNISLDFKGDLRRRQHPLIGSEADPDASSVTHRAYLSNLCRADDSVADCLSLCALCMHIFTAAMLCHDRLEPRCSLRLHCGSAGAFNALATSASNLSCRRGAKGKGVLRQERISRRASRTPSGMRRWTAASAPPTSWTRPRLRRRPAL